MEIYRSFERLNSVYLKLDGSNGPITGPITINFNGSSPLIINNTAGSTNLLTLNTAGQLQLSTQGATGGLLIGGDTLLYRDAADSFYTLDKFRADGGIASGAALTSVVFNYFSKTVSTALASPVLLKSDLTVTGAITGFGATQAVNVTLNSGANTIDGLGAIFGFATLTSGSMASTAYGLFYTARDSRSGGYTGTTLGGASVTGQIGSSCNTVYSNAVYGGIFTVLDLSTGGAVPTAPSAAAGVFTLTVGNMDVANGWKYIWALAGSGTTSSPVYGLKVDRIANSTLINDAINLDGTNEVNNRIRWGLTNWVSVNRSANHTLTFDAADGAAQIISTGKFRANDVFNHNGTDGVATATFTTVDGKTVTVAGGIITGVAA